MKLPLWALRWLHRRRFSRRGMRGGILHSWLGDRLLDKALWKPTQESVARAWLIGLPVTMIPFLPGQSLIAGTLAFFFRGNLLLCIALQFLSTPLTAPIQLPACYWVGKMIQGENPVEVWREVTANPAIVFSAQGAIALYLGAIVLGLAIGVIGYFLIHHQWREPRPRVRPTPPPPPPVV